MEQDHREQDQGRDEVWVEVRDAPLVGEKWEARDLEQGENVFVPSVAIEWHMRSERHAMS